MSLNRFSKEYSLRTKRGQEMRKKAWPAIRKCLEEASVDKDTISSVCKQMYLEGIEEPEWTRRGLFLSTYLMCDPLSSKTEWRQRKRDESYGGLYESRRSFMDIQKNSCAYVYNNSMYAGREKEIYDYLYADVEDKDLEWTATAAPNRIVEAYLRSVRIALGDMRPNVFTQLWRDIDYFEQALQEAKKVGLKPWRGSKMARTLFCEVQFISRNPEKFDELIVNNANRLHGLFTNKKLHLPLAEAYKKTIEKDYERFKKLSAAGSKVSFAIRYPDAEIMQAAYDMLHDDTRYPRSEDFPKNAPIEVPRMWSETIASRPSADAICELWSDGFYVKESGQLDERTLIATTCCPLDSSRVLYLLERLCRNLSAIKWRITSRDGHQDEHTSSAIVGKGVYALELPSGEVRAGTLGYYNSSHQASSGFNQDTKRALGCLGSLEDSMKILIEQRTHLQKIGKKRKDWEG